MTKKTNARANRSTAKSNIPKRTRHAGPSSAAKGERGDEILAISNAGARTGGDGRGSSRLTSLNAEQSMSLLEGIAPLATALWRANTKLAREPIDALPSELRNLPRHIESALSVLGGMGVEVVSHEGELYVPGMAVSVAAFQPEPGLRKEVVLESISPSVFLAGHLIQRATVIVGQPLLDTDCEVASSQADECLNREPVPEEDD